VPENWHAGPAPENWHAGPAPSLRPARRRIEYAGLWSALIFGDEAGITRHAAAMNAADSVPFFAGMLTMRPWAEVTRCARAPAPAPAAPAPAPAARTL